MCVGAFPQTVPFWGYFPRKRMWVCIPLGQRFYVFCSLLLFQSLEQCLAHSKSSVKVCWLNRLLDDCGPEELALFPASREACSPRRAAPAPGCSCSFNFNAFAFRSLDKKQENFPALGPSSPYPRSCKLAAYWCLLLGLCLLFFFRNEVNYLPTFKKIGRLHITIRISCLSW